MDESWREFWGWIVVAMMGASLVYLASVMPTHRGVGLLWDVAAFAVCLGLGAVGLFLAMGPPQI